MYENKKAFREEVIGDYQCVIKAIKPTTHTIDKALSKMVFYSKLYGEDKEIETMVETLFNKFFAVR